MSSLNTQDTTLLSAPYFDDTTQAQKKHYHRLLFRPAVAVQARELTQLQSILQNQIERFGNHIFKDGSVVQGCAVEYSKDLEFIGVVDQFSTNSSLALNDVSLINSIAIGANSGVQALVVATNPGYIRQTPGKLFLRYTQPGTYANVSTRTFVPGEQINLYGSSATYIENVVLTVANTTNFVAGQVVNSYDSAVPPNLVARAAVMAVGNTTSLTVNNIQKSFAGNTSLIVDGNNSINTSISAVKLDVGTLIGSINMVSAIVNDGSANVAITANNISGYAYGAHISDGIIFHKGHFISVDPQNIIVNQNSNDPAGYLLGFLTSENVITENIDSTLYDNALGYSNFNAPGAHRLQLISTCVSKAANSVLATDKFFAIVEFSNTGVAFERTDAQYAALGDEIAKRTFEESGHYIVKPFLISSNTNPSDPNTVYYDVSPGLAYVEGYRVELLANLPIKGRRGVDTVSFSNQIVSTAIGNFINVNQVIGRFGIENAPTVTLYDTAQAGVSGLVNATSAAVGTKIGTANIREISYVDAINPKGTAAAVYKAYLYNISMLANASFNNVKSIALAANTGAALGASADAIQVANATHLQQTTSSPLLFALGAKAVKSLVDANGAFNSSYYYNYSANGVTDATAKVTINIPTASGIPGFSTGVASDTIDSLVSVTALQTIVSPNTFLSTITANSTGAWVTNANAVYFDTGDDLQYGGAINYNVIGANTTVVQLAPNTAQAVSNTVSRLIQNGGKISLAGASRAVTVSGQNVTIDLGIAGLAWPTGASLNFRIYTNQNSAKGLKKKIQRSTVVMIQTGVTPTTVTEWNLGIPDALKIRSVFAVSGNTANAATLIADTTSNLKGYLTLLNGQKDDQYDHAHVVLAPGASLLANTVYSVEFDHFIYDVSYAVGAGFFSIDSYPIDDSYAANTAATIKTYEVPTYFSSAAAKTYDLRDAIDFRPYRGVGAVVTNNLRLASLSANASSLANTSYNTSTTTAKPLPDQNFTCNFTNYLPRKDVLLVNGDGQFSIKEGISSLAPRTPTYPADALGLAVIAVSAFPSLADSEKSIANRTDYVLSTSILQNKRYTMHDISAIDARVKNLEYYVSLNSLEASAATFSILTATGTNRFKNGIFVDTLNDHAFGRVDHPGYSVAIDSKNNSARPPIHPEYHQMEYDANNSTGTQKTGNLITLAYDEEAYLVQDYATAGPAANTTPGRPVASAPQSFIGRMTVSPETWTEVEYMGLPQTVNITDKASLAVSRMVAAPLTQQYGFWRDTARRGIAELPQASDSVIAETLRTKTSLTTGEQTYGFDNSAEQGVNVQPYMRSREVNFTAWGLKPYTVFNVYVDDILVSNYCATGKVIPGNNNDFDVLRTSPWGSTVTSDSRGNAFGKLSVPGFAFKVSQHIVSLLSVEKNASTNTQVSSASAAFNVRLIYAGNPPVVNLTVKPPEPPRQVANNTPAPTPVVYVPNTNPVVQTVPGPRPPAGASTNAPNSVTRAPGCDFGIYGTSPSPLSTSHNYNMVSFDRPTTYPLASWLWKFSTTDGASISTANTANVNVQYIVPDGSIITSVSLTVTDTANVSTTCVQPLTIVTLPVAPPAPPPTPPGQTSDVFMRSSSGGNDTGGAKNVIGTGSVAVTVVAQPLSPIAGGKFAWTTLPANTANSTQTITTTFPNSGSNNDTVVITTTDLTTAGANQSVSFTPVATYQFANSFTVNSTSNTLATSSNTISLTATTAVILTNDPLTGSAKPVYKNLAP
jgi:hypothetical protein